MKAIIKGNHPQKRYINYIAYSVLERDIVIEHLEDQGYELEISEEPDVEMVKVKDQNLNAGWFEVKVTERFPLNKKIKNFEVVEWKGPSFKPNLHETELTNYVEVKIFDTQFERQLKKKEKKNE